MDVGDLLNDDNISDDSRAIKPVFRILGLQGSIELTSQAAIDLGYVFKFINSNAEVEITGYNNLGGEIKIPSKIDGKTVTSIGDKAFKSKKLTKVTIPETVTSIKYAAFSSNLIESVIIPEGVKIIEESTFSNNILKSVKIPTGVTHIKNYAFANNLLETIIIPSRTIEIGVGAFDKNQQNPNDFTIYGGLDSIAGSYATSRGHNFQPVISLEKTKIYLIKEAEEILIATVLPEDRINKEIGQMPTICHIQSGQIRWG